MNTNTSTPNFGPRHFCKEKMEQKYKQMKMNGHPFAAKFEERFSGNHLKVNITEKATEFLLHLFAPGLEKTGFEVSVKDQRLSLKYTQPEKNEAENYLVQEFSPKSFNRDFQLSDKILEDTISAKYENGILTVILPKNPEKNKKATLIPVQN